MALNQQINNKQFDKRNMRKIPKVFVNSVKNSITLNSKQQKCSLIWLHGLGDTSEGFMSFFSHSQSPLYQGVRIKMIQAPERPVTINGGAICNSWYDLRSTKRFTEDQNKVFNFQQMQQSSKTIQNNVEQQVKFWQSQQPNSQINPYHRVFVGGFSQGGVMSLYYGMQAKNIPAGVISLSGYMLKSTPLTNHKKFPVCLMHGQDDQVINQLQAKKSYERILSDSRMIQYHNIRKLGHTVNLSQLSLMKDWFKQVNQTINVHYSSNKKVVSGE